MAAFTFGGDPPPEVSAYFRDKNLRPAFRWTEVWGQEHAHAFTVAKAVQLDVLTAIRDSLQTAIDKGVPYEQWAKALTPELQRLGWWGQVEMADPATGEVRPRQLGSPRRLRTIYDANLRTARAAGQWERAQRTKAVLPYFSYELGPSEHHRPEHVAREGTIAPVDDPIWNAWYPPNGWGCKCWLRQITRSEAGARGGPTPDLSVGPEVGFTRRRDDGTAERITVPKGIDPGWATNPGKSRSQTLMQSLATKLDEAGPATARAAMADFWEGSTPKAISELPERVFAPVAIASPALKAALGATADVVMVGSGELAAKVAKHGAKGSRAMRPSDFGKVQAVLDQGHIVASRGRQVMLARLPDGWWQAVLKTAGGGREVILASFYPVGDRKVRRTLR